MNKKKNLVSLILIANVLFAADIYISWRAEEFISANAARGILESDGHRVVVEPIESYPPPPEIYDILYLLPLDSFTVEEIEFLQSHVASGGRGILISGVIYHFINIILSDPLWDDSLGNIRDNCDLIRDFPPDTIDDFAVVKFPNFAVSTGYFRCVDTLIARARPSYSILSPDSGTARPFIWGRRICCSSVYDSFAVVGITARYGAGELIILGEIFHYLISPSTFNTTNWGDNRQFIRNLFTTNDRADSVWLTGTDSSFTIFLPGSTPFVAGSTSFSFESAAYGLWGLRASDWSYWHTDSSITIQYPDTCPMGETFEVCVKLVPDATGETVLPTGAICDSFTFNYTGITETATPEHFAISAYPNPFNSAVSISLDCRSEPCRRRVEQVGCGPAAGGVGASDARSGQVGIEIFDISGRLVADLPVTNCGEPQFVTTPQIWRPEKSLGSGIYLIRARFGDCKSTKRIVYLK